MEIVKINLTAEKVQKLMDKADANNTFNEAVQGYIAPQYKVVETFVEALQSKLGFERVGLCTMNVLLLGQLVKLKTFLLSLSIKVIKLVLISN